MGRGGGGGGGGRSSGGGHSSRSFGGSSSHSSRGGGSYHSSRSYNRSSYSSGPHIHVSHHYGPRYGYGRTTYVGGGSVLTAIVTFFMIVILIIAITGALNGAVNGVTKSTVEREPLKPYASFNKDALDDDAGWIHDRNALRDGMESFYKQTGIQPALAIYEDFDGERYLNDSEIEDFMTDEYDRLIGHERGLLLLFCEYADSDWYAYYMAGEDAQTVMDSEATDILMDYVSSLYTNDSYSDEEYFGAVFEKTADRIMTVSPTFASRIPVIVGGVVVICLAFAGVSALKQKHKRDAEKAEETERILKSPIERL